MPISFVYFLPDEDFLLKARHVAGLTALTAITLTRKPGEAIHFIT